MPKTLIQGTIASKPNSHYFLGREVGTEYYVHPKNNPEDEILIVLPENMAKLMLVIGQKVEIIGEKYLKQHTHEMYIKAEEISFSFAGK